MFRLASGVREDRGSGMVESQGAAVVLVHGAGGGAWCWGPVGEQLDARGIEHVEVDLPTCAIGVNPMVDSHADAAYVRSVLDRLDRPVLLCGNSYGGVVITEASAGHPRVGRLVYLAAFMPDPDEELLPFLMANCTPESVTGFTFGDDGLGGLDPEVAKKTVFQQATHEVAAWAADQLRPMAMGSGGSPTVTGVGWQAIPSTYVVCTEDRTILPESQRRWAAQRATDTVEVPFDHCPHLSHPVEIADLLAKLATTLAL
jgi:pimeloyl-ACP methyl ester carboxylesterase